MIFFNGLSCTCRIPLWEREVSNSVEERSRGALTKSCLGTMGIYWGYIGIMENKMETTIL